MNLNSRTSIDKEKSKRKEKEFNFRRSEILAEAEKVFAAKGFYSATMADIAQASGFAVGSLYQFFPSKEELYLTMVNEKMDLMYSSLVIAAEGETGTAEKLRALINAYFRFVENNLDFCNLFFRGSVANLSSGATTLRDRIFEDYVKQAGYIENIIKSGIKAGEFKGLDSRTASFMISGMVRGIIFDWMMTGRPGPLEEKTSAVLGVFLHGVCR